MPFEIWKSVQRFKSYKLFLGFRFFILLAMSIFIESSPCTYIHPYLLRILDKNRFQVVIIYLHLYKSQYRKCFLKCQVFLALMRLRLQKPFSQEYWLSCAKRYHGLFVHEIFFSYKIELQLDIKYFQSFEISFFFF